LAEGGRSSILCGEQRLAIPWIGTPVDVPLSIHMATWIKKEY
jgi:hypothetical protein